MEGNFRKDSDMNEFDTAPSQGIFYPPAVKELLDAFAKAERHLERWRASTLGDIDRDRVARKIVLEVRSGETQPDLVWRAAVAKVLLEARFQTWKAEDDQAATSKPPQHERQPKPSAATEIPSAGPHAEPRHTNEDATPGAGALPDKTPGDEVDPGTG
jgi:hypothetical protein